jgi:hypothetical protein
VTQALLPIAGAVFVLASCYALGRLLAVRLGLRLNREETFPLALLLGASVLQFAIFLVFAAHVAYLPVLHGLLGLPILAVLWTGDWRLPKDHASHSLTGMERSLGWMFALLAVVFSALYLANAWAPEVSPDGSSYHLGFVARYLREHGFVAIPTNMYSGLSAGVEMLYAGAFSVGKHSAAALTHFGFLIALGLMIRAYGRRIGQPLAGSAAALLVYLSPVVGVDGSSAYIDAALAAGCFATFYIAELYCTQLGAADVEAGTKHHATGQLIAIGLLAGFCVSAKYTAFTIALFAIGYVLLRSRKLGPAIIVGGCVALMLAPWLIKNWIYFNNPLAPFGNAIFRNPFLHPELERSWSEQLRHYEVRNMWALPLEVTIRGAATQGLIGVAFLAAPLALLAWGRRSLRPLLIAALLLLCTYPANIGTRFLIPALPFIALATLLAIQDWAPRLTPALAVLLVATQAIAAWPGVIRKYAPTAWMLPHQFAYSAALRRVPEEEYRNEQPEFRQVAMIDKLVPPGERVLIFGSLPDSYTSRELLVAFQSGINESAKDLLNTGWVPDFRPTRLLVYSFPARPVRRIRLVQTAQMPMPTELWSIAELRFYAKGQEVARQPQWNLRAFPNPWDAGLALDNSIATRWRTWETAHPGDFLEVDFGQPLSVDEVRVQTTSDNWDVRLRVETSDGSGAWQKAADQAQELSTRLTGSLRLAAAYELNLQGIRYVLVKDDDFGADQFSKRPQSWNFEVLAHEAGATLYRVMPVTLTAGGAK